MSRFHIKELLFSLGEQLKVLKRLNVFTDEEIQAVKDNRNHHVQLIQSDNSSCEDVLLCIRYELDLLGVVREKKVDEKLVKDKNRFTFSSGNFLNRLFAMVTDEFPNELQLWLLYVKFCQEMKDTITLLKIIERLLKAHRDKPSVFQLASRCAREDLENLKQARAFIAVGIHAHPDSPELYREAFLLELSVANENYDSLKKTTAKQSVPPEIAESLREKQAKESVDNDPSVSVKEDLTKLWPSLTVKMQQVYEVALKVIVSVDFFLDLFDTVRGVPFAKALSDKMSSDLRKKFPKEERMWDTFAKIKVEFMKETLAKIDEDKKPKDPTNKVHNPIRPIINDIISVYESGIAHVNTLTMWRFYLDRLVDIYNDKSLQLEKFQKNCLLEAFVKAHINKKLDEKYYLIWADLKDTEGQMEMLRTYAVKALPTSVPLWSKMIMNRLCAHVDKEAFPTEAWEVFQEALVRFEEDQAPSTFPLWKLMYRYFLCSFPSKVEWLLLQATHETSGAAAQMKILFLEWCMLTNGVLETRKLYHTLAANPPFSMELHEKMIEFEGYQPVLNVKFVRQCFELSVEQFGNVNISSWIRYIEFEYTYGKRDNVIKIKENAFNQLQPALIDEFTSQMSLCEITFITTSRRQIISHKLTKSLFRRAAGKGKKKKKKKSTKKQ